MTRARQYAVHAFAACALSLQLGGCGGPAPEASDTRSTTTEARPQQVPPPLPERPLEFPSFHETLLDNGLRLIVVEHAGQPVANLDLYIRPGRTADPADKAGLAEMVAELLTKGTANRSATEISETIERVGGSLNSSAGHDWITLSAGVLAEHLELAFDLASDVVLRPSFPEDELALARRRMLSALQAELGQPGVIAERRFLRDVYGEHPYGVSMTPATVEGLTREDLVAFHRERFAAEDALLVVSGVLDAAEAEALAERYFGEWIEASAMRVELPAPPSREALTITLVHRPGSVQSNIRVGHLGIRPDNPDYFALLVLNNILGGGTDARLFQILREEKGWTYGAYSSLTRQVDIGHFAARAEVRSEVTGDALLEMLHQLRRLRDERVSDVEFEAAKSYLAGSFPLRIETAGQIANQVAQARLLDVPIEHVTRFRENILAVTAEDVQRVAREYIHPERGAIVVVGDARQILAMLETVAPVALYDVEGRPLERDAIEVRAATERFDGTRLEPGTRTYQLLLQGSPAGTYTLELELEGDVWVATRSMQSPIISQQSELRFAADDLTPIAVRSQLSQGPVTLSTTLDHAEGRMTGRLDMPEEAGGARSVDEAVPAGTLLPEMDEHALAVADLDVGHGFTLPVFDTMTGSVTAVTYSVTGTEEVTVPAGTFDAFRVEVEGGQQPMVLAVRRAPPHVMLRQELIGTPVVIELTSLD